jgi:Ca2+-binding EF-hand superfamily protein
MKPLFALALCALALFLALPAISGEGAGLRHRLDLDKDGKLDHGELRAVLEEVMGNLDADKDGKVDHGELKAKLDTDKDGKIDHGELRAALQTVKAKLDTDKDGKIDHGELRAALKNLKETHPKLFAHIMERIRERRERKQEGAAK